jgi:hypothetical protein
VLSAFLFIEFLYDYCVSFGYCVFCLFHIHPAYVPASHARFLDSFLYVVSSVSCLTVEGTICSYPGFGAI